MAVEVVNPLDSRVVVVSSCGELENAQMKLTARVNLFGLSWRHKVSRGRSNIYTITVAEFPDIDGRRCISKYGIWKMALLEFE